MTVEQHPNADVIAGLRQAAAWLAQHPELPEAYYASISFRSAYTNSNAREDLTRLAEALGERAVEKAGNGEVLIQGEFEGGIRVSAVAKIAALRDEPEPDPEYEPIIARRDEIPVTDAEDEAWGVAS